MDILSWGYKRGISSARKQIEKAIKKKRLVLLGDNHLLYIDKQGKRHTYNFEQFAPVFIEIVGGNSIMPFVGITQATSLGITNQDIVNILVEEYAKQKKEAK